MASDAEVQAELDHTSWAALLEVDGDVLDALARLTQRPAWHAWAACRGQGPALWYPRPGDDPTEARQICAGCPVAAECAAAGRNERHGRWGGLTPDQRAARRRTAA